MNKAITYGTVCSGIGCAEQAADQFGWRQLFCSEIDPFASAVLAHHRPSVPNLGDMTLLCEKVHMGECPAPDVLIAGTPCQAFSIAGARRSLDDARGNLTLALVELFDAVDFVRIAHGEEPGILVWENVPGVLSVGDNAFGCFLGALVGADAAIPPFGNKGRWPRAGLVRGSRRSASWRILDAQWFGVAQKRRRLFVVAGAGDRFDPSAVLLESEGGAGNPRPSREARKDVADPFANCAGSYGGYRNDADAVNNLIVPELSHALSSSRGVSRVGDPRRQDILVAYGGNNTSGPIEVATARNAHGGPHGRLDFETETFVVQTVSLRGRDGGGTVEVGGDLATAVRASQGGGDKPHVLVSTVQGGDVAHALNTANNGKHCSEDGTGRGVSIIAFDARQDTVSSEESFGSLGSSSPQSQAIATIMSGVRRLTPVECERLMGLRDNFTNVPYRGKPAADGPRYRAIGNGMVVPVMCWILFRLEEHMRGLM